MDPDPEKIEAFHELLHLGQKRNWSDDEYCLYHALKWTIGITQELLEKSPSLKAELTETLRVQLKSDDWQIAFSAAEDLGILRIKETVSDLVASAASHTDKKVRVATIEALGRTGHFNAQVKELLHHLTRHRAKMIAEAAKDALRELAETERQYPIGGNAARELSAAPDAKSLLSAYRNGKYSTDSERTQFLELALRLLAGEASWEDFQPFPWPSTTAFPSEKPELQLDGEFEERGMLAHLGYHVGKNGLPPKKRRGLLNSILESETLPRINSKQYVLEWSTSGSSVRLRKMAESIAAFCRNAKRRKNATMSESIRSWEADLAWLKVQFYDNRFTFRWPSTN